MTRLYYDPTLNPAKVALFLEETGRPDEVVLVGRSQRLSSGLELG